LTLYGLLYTGTIHLYMEYNTSRPKIAYLEYGRNLQNIIEKLIDVEDDEVRTRGVMAVINMMAQLNPNLKTYEDYKQKLWDHLILISKFKLKVDSPYPLPLPAEKREVPQTEYPKNNLKDKTYGKGVERMVAKASEMEDPEKKKEFARIIANYLKMIQSHWNREIITDELAKFDLQRMSKGKLSVDEDLNLAKFTPGLPVNKKNTRGKPIGKSGGSNRPPNNGGGFRKKRQGVSGNNGNNNNNNSNINFRNER